MERDGLLKSPSQSLMDKSLQKLQELDAELAECETYLSELERILITLAGGRLPPTLVPATLLSEDFQTMYVQISVPLQDFGSDLKLYRVHNLPLKVRNGYSVTADIDTEYLLTAKKGEYHLELKKEDFQDCQTFQKDGQNFFCGFPPLLKSSEHQTCVIQLFNVMGDGAMCQSKVTHGLVQPFNRLYNGSWVFAALNAQVPVVMKCPNNTLTTSLLGFGVINLLEGCTLSADDYMYPHTFTGFSDIDLAIEVGLELEDNEDLEGLQSSTLGSVNFNGQAATESSTFDDYQEEDYHVSESYDDYGDFETMIISAVVAEQEQNGLNADSINENFFTFDKSTLPGKSGVTTSPSLDVTTLLDGSSEELTTQSQVGDGVYNDNGNSNEEDDTTTPNAGQESRKMVYF